MNLFKKISVILICILCGTFTIIHVKSKTSRQNTNSTQVVINNNKTFPTQKENNILCERIVYESIDADNNCLNYLNINEIEFPRVQLVSIPEQPKTLYDTFTEEEINLIEVTVQHEVGAFSDKYKKFITELIYNRLVSDDFPNTISEVLYQENQFCGIQYWYSPDYKVDNNTKQVVKEVFSQDTTSHQATYYYNPELSDYQSIAWFEYSGDVEYLFEYTEEDWGIEYTTRFFK